MTRRIALANTAVTELAFCGDADAPDAGWHVLRVNDVSHLLSGGGREVPPDVLG